MFAVAIFVLLVVALLVGVFIGHWSGWNDGYSAGQMREREAVVRAIDRLEKAYGVDLGSGYFTDCPGCGRSVDVPPDPACPICNPPGDWCEQGPTDPADPVMITAEEWCARKGTNMTEMAEAQEIMEAEREF